MSWRERHYAALSRQGKLTETERRILKSDLLHLLNSKNRPKSEEDLKAELSRHCGWDRHTICGPRPLVESCLNQLETDGLAESDTYPTERPLNSNKSKWWITTDGADAREARISYNTKVEEAKLAEDLETAAFFNKWNGDK